MFRIPTVHSEVFDPLLFLIRRRCHLERRRRRLGGGGLLGGASSGGQSPGVMGSGSQPLSGNLLVSAKMGGGQGGREGGREREGTR